MLDISGTRRLMSVIIRPRPSLRVLRQTRPILPRRPYPYSLYAKARLRRDCYYVPDASRETEIRVDTSTEVSSDAAGSVYSTSLPVVEEEPAYLSSTDTSTDGRAYTSSYTSTCDSSSPAYEPSPDPDTPRLLRSSRRRKCQSINDVEEAFMKIKDGGEQCLRTTNTWPRMSRSLSWILTSSSEPSGWQPLAPVTIQQLDADDSTRKIWRIKDPIKRFSDPRIWWIPQAAPPDDSNCTDPTQYYTALTSYQDTTKDEESRVLQAIDRGSGAVFERVCYSNGGDIERSDHLQNNHADDLPYQLVPSCLVSQNTAVLSQPLGSLAQPQPSLMLTVPTPMVPQSPFFVLQSPITVHKFFSAVNTDGNEASPPQTGSVPAAPMPTLSSCGECGLVEFETGAQCRSCERQWLACKVWYRAQDGGRRRWLTEPYIRPGESNARNRALMHGLGLPGCLPSELEPHSGLDAEGATKTRKGLRRVWRFWNAKAVRAGSKTGDASRKGKNGPSVGDRAVRPLRAILEFSKTLAMLGLGFLWVTFVKSWSYTVYVRREEDGPGDVATSEDDWEAMSRRDLHDCSTQFPVGGASACAYQTQGSVSLPPPPQSALSKFVEHLTDDLATSSVGGTPDNCSDDAHS